jgi:hypothetical protein
MTFRQMTMAQAVQELPPALFHKYYARAQEFFATNAHLARDINDLVIVVRDFDPNQPRDEEGKWTDGGGGDGAGGGGGAGVTPQVTQGDGTSAEKYNRIKTALAVIPASHAAQIKDVSISFVKSQYDMPSQFGVSPQAEGLFAFNGKSRIFVAESKRSILNVPPSTWKPDRPTPPLEQWITKETFLPTKQIEQVTVHELGHALDHATEWKHSANIAKLADAAKAQLTAREKKNGAYWLNNDRETFAELYTTLYNPNDGDDQRYFGGLTRARAKSVFKAALAAMKEIKQFGSIILRTAKEISSGWFVNEDGALYALFNGMPYEVDVTGTPLEGVRFKPGTYKDDDTLASFIQVSPHPLG